MPDYLALKHLHVTLVVLSVCGFVLRWSWLQVESPLSKHRLTRVLPHILDTFLLLSGIGLAILIRQGPFSDAWLGAKLAGLLAYILLGAAAMKLSPRRIPAVCLFLLALLTFAWMTSIATTKQPAGFFSHFL